MRIEIGIAEFRSAHEKSSIHQPSGQLNNPVAVAMLHRSHSSMTEQEAIFFSDILCGASELPSTSPPMAGRYDAYDRVAFLQYLDMQNVTNYAELVPGKTIQRQPALRCRGWGMRLFQYSAKQWERIWICFSVTNRDYFSSLFRRFFDCAPGSWVVLRNASSYECFLRECRKVQEEHSYHVNDLQRECINYSELVGVTYDACMLDIMSKAFNRAELLQIISTAAEKHGIELVHRKTG
jgi:hypothetical protein